MPPGSRLSQEVDMTRLVFISVILMASVLVGCSGSKSTGPAQGRLQVFLQDASAKFDSIKVNIQEISVRYNYAPPDSETGWYIIYDDSLTYDLVKLRNGRREQLFNRDVPTGFYRYARIIFGGCLAVRNDTVYSLEFPSTAGNRVVSEGYYVEVVKDETAEALIDIDVYSTIQYDADSSRYYFSPQFRYIAIDSTGGVNGNIIPAADIYMTVHDQSDTLGMTTTEFNHAFGFFGLPRGYYDFFIFPRDTTYQDWEIINVPVIPGTNYNVGTIELPR